MANFDFEATFGVSGCGHVLAKEIGFGRRIGRLQVRVPVPAYIQIRGGPSEPTGFGCTVALSDRFNNGAH
jgi:hypothetical protein